ncbi:MAG: phytanoyl-CoA dioxygenase family protein [Burkholderiales bacterium]
MTAQNPLPGVPLVESPFFEELAKALPPAHAAVAASLHRDGFAVIDFPEEDFEKVAAELIGSLEPHYDLKGWRERKGQGARGGPRIQDASELSASVRRVACNPSILDLLSSIYGRRAFPFQTLNFPVGTEQHFHSDSLHFSCIPERFMCGVWVALEDVGPEQGPLVYYPGSHKLPIYWNEHYGYFMTPGRPHDQADYHAAWDRLVAVHGIQPHTFHARRGQAFIWAANLLHGGVEHRDVSKTRWSQVTHYYFEDCVYLVPMQSDPIFGRVALKKVTDLRSGRPVEPTYLGRPLSRDVIKFFDVSFKRKEKVVLPADFDGNGYLNLHPDVREAGLDPAHHYLKHGIWEGRRYK